MESIVERFGIPQTALLFAVPVWLLQRWLNGTGLLFAAQKRHIWVMWATFFAPWKLRSTFDIITSGRFVPDPVDGSLGWHKRMKSEPARRAHAYQAAGRRKRRKKRAQSK